MVTEHGATLIGGAPQRGNVRHLVLGSRNAIGPVDLPLCRSI
jgi:hypothetical protein